MSEVLHYLRENRARDSPGLEKGALYDFAHSSKDSEAIGGAMRLIEPV